LPNPPSRTIFEDEAIPVHGNDASALVPVREERVGGRVDADAVAEMNLREGRHRRADDAQLASLQVHPQRLAEFGQAFERLARTVL